jgi:hypothetical protein
MDSQYKNLEQIIDEFNLKLDVPEEMRAELRSRQSPLHPDRHKGEFANKEPTEAPNTVARQKPMITSFIWP